MFQTIPYHDYATSRLGPFLCRSNVVGNVCTYRYFAPYGSDARENRLNGA